MKKEFGLLIFISLLFSLQLVFSQGKIDAYKAEADGYFMHPVNTTAGVIVTDNFASKIYLIQNNDLKELVSTPGCGRYFTVSPDKLQIGYKFITANGMQVPATYNLVTGNISQLSKPVKLCGQPSFGNNGKMAFTIGNELNVLDNGSIQKFDLGVYSNITPISPDGNNAIYNDDKDQLFIINLASGKVEQITDNKCGYDYPQWSPDGNKLAYSTLSGKIMIWDKTAGTTFSIGAGENVSWSDDSQYIIYNRTTVENFEYKGSDIYMAKFDGSKIINLTNTTDVNEIAPSFGLNNTVIYSTFEKRGIISATLDLQNFQLKNKSILILCSSQSLIKSNNSCNNKSVKNVNSIVMIPGNVPYVHQVYDTPTWHSGYSSCAPTTAIMALAYYNRLPKWPTVVDHGHSWDPHTSNYGSYVADEYRYNGTFYNLTASDYASNTSWGGYGYMWNGSGSPNSMMATYIQNHNVTSVHSDTTTFSGVKVEINKNYPFPICNTLSTAGHLTLAVGYLNAQHTLIFNDPYGDKDTLTWPNYYGKNAYYDWPGYNNGYQNLNSVAWTVTAEATQLTYNDTIIDDVNYNHGFYIYNQSPSHMKYFHDSETGGYGTYTHFWWTYTSTSTTIDTCYVKWMPTLSATGNYEVFAYIPNSSSYVTSTTAQYKVHYTGGIATVVVDQATNLGQWVSLGTYPFNPSDSGYVRLGDGGDASMQKIAFDAMKWNYAGAITGIDHHTSSDFLLSISPNPAKNNITISYKPCTTRDAEIIIYDMLGKVYLDKKIVIGSSGSEVIDISKLTSSLYVLEVKSEGKSYFSKISVI